MPISYRIHTDFRLLVTRYVEVVTDDEFIETYQSILGDPGFRHGFNELADLQELRDFAVTANAMKHVSGLVSRFYVGRWESTRTAVISPRDDVYGVSRMYSAYADPDSEVVTVFKDAEEAMRSLGLNSVSLAELHGEKPGTD